MADEVRVEELWGVGTRYDLGCRGGWRVSVIARKDGRTELYVFESGAEEPTSRIELAADQAKRLGSILSGTYFRD